MGAWVASRGRSNHSLIRAIIGDSPFSSLDEMFGTRSSLSIPFWGSVVSTCPPGVVWYHCSATALSPRRSSTWPKSSAPLGRKPTIEQKYPCSSWFGMKIPALRPRQGVSGLFTERFGTGESHHSGRMPRQISENTVKYREQ
jgi:hypothetical protein